MLKFLLDEDMSYRVAQGLRDCGIDAVSVHDIGRTGLTDEDHLLFATEQGRVLVTYNRGDFQALDSRWRDEQRLHAGILWCAERILPRRAFGDLIRSLEAAANRWDSLDSLGLPLHKD